jgi:Thioredoxin-like
MAKARMALGVAAGCLLAWGSAAPAWAGATVADILRFTPKQQGVAMSTPAAQEEAGCKVEWVQTKNSRAGTYLLRDAKGQLLRRFTDTNGDGQMDVWSYFKDGVEVYREIDTDFNKKPDQFRWFNAAGMKWGVDQNEDGRIDAWKAISAEEASQELLQACVAHDFARFQALLITDAEVKQLELPADQAGRLRDLRAKAQSKFEAALAKLTGLSDKTHWVHVELTPPQCLPADQTGMKQDLFKYANGTVLCETNGKNEWLQTGEMILVGQAWRLTDAPAVGPQDFLPDGGGDVAEKELQPLLEQLNDLDKKAPAASAANADIIRYNLQRADILERIVAQVKPEKRDNWIRQVADSLSAAAQSSPAGDKTAYQRLLRLEEQIVAAMPGSALASYVTFREMSADYAVKVSDPKANTDIGKTQDAWLERLATFVKTYPKTEEAADAYLQLGMVSEFVSKEVEAKKWYQQLATTFADKPVAAKALGALKRLDLEGKPLELAGPKLTDGSNFDISSLQGKIVVVYYWASWNGQTVGDFAKLKLLLDSHASQGVELVTVNLDTIAQEALDFLKKAPAPGTHLFQPGGLDSPFATQYGVMGLPNLFLVGKDGKVASRTVQLTTLEDELKKLTK